MVSTCVMRSALQLPLAQADTLPQSSVRPSLNNLNPAVAPSRLHDREEDDAVKGELFNDSYSSSISDVEDKDFGEFLSNY